MEKDRIKKFLEERGYGSEGLSPVGELFALLQAKAKEKQVDTDEFGQSRALIAHFCKGLLKLSKEAKPIGPSPEMDQLMLVFALVNVFADRAQLEEWASESKRRNS